MKLLPAVDKLRETSFLSSYVKDQLDNQIVSIDGKLFINSPLFIISNIIEKVDWGVVDAIFISTVSSYLIVPIILRNTSFCGTIYTSSAIHSVQIK